MLNLRHLRLLCELARHETIAKVAEVVGYTPSAVSQALAQLERDVDRGEARRPHGKREPESEEPGGPGGGWHTPTFARSDR